MTRAINLTCEPREKLRQFQEFVFIGQTTNDFATKSSKQLHLNLNNSFLSEVRVKKLWKITQINTSNNLIQELKSLGIQLGAVIELVSRSNRGSVVISRDGKLIGIGSAIAQSIVVTLAGATPQVS